MLCNSCNAPFDEEGARNAHYRSEWHRYNLKRKVAGLPGVTEDWFETRRAAAAAAVAESAAASGAADKDSTGQPVTRFECSVCCKQYGSRKAFDNHLKSRGHVARAAAAPEGSAASDPVVKARKTTSSSNSNTVSEAATPSAEGNEGVSLSVKASSGSGAGRKWEAERAKRREEEEEEEEEEGEEEEGEEGEWEEVEDEEEVAAIMEVEEEKEKEKERKKRVVQEGGASSRGADSAPGAEEAEGEGEEEEEGEEWEWDCGRCLFCDRVFPGSVEGCVSHMHKAHGFFLPDAEYIDDLTGMLTYLALKINEGHLCLYCDERGKAFPSAEAVKGHMEAKNHCKLRYGDGSGLAEEELEEFYDFSASYEENGAAGMELALANGEEAPSHLALHPASLGLIVRSSTADGGGGSKVLGSREFARFYRQRPKPNAANQSLMLSVVSRYKSMGLSTKGLRTFVSAKEMAKRDTGIKASKRAEQFRTRVAFSNNIIRNLPKNVPY